MKHITRFAFLLCVLFLFIPLGIRAAGFQLTSIGAMDVTGAVSREWWYTSANPVLRGVTTQNGSVEYTVDGVSQTTVTADADGNWSIASSLTEGDHTISLISNGSTIAFTLHITSVLPTGLAAPTVSDVPVAGSPLPTILTIGLAAIFVMVGLSFGSLRRG